MVPNHEADLTPVGVFDMLLEVMFIVMESIAGAERRMWSDGQL